MLFKGDWLTTFSEDGVSAWSESSFSCFIVIPSSSELLWDVFAGLWEDFKNSWVVSFCPELLSSLISVSAASYEL
jgi:hypothetical protein